MLELDLITDPAAAGISLDPVRARILAELATAPGSASSLARTFDIARQKINYHLRTLEDHGLVRLVEERRRGGLTERVFEATAATYVISPAAMAGVAPDPDRAPDRLSARWLVAVAARTVGEVGELLAGATAAGKRLATFTATTEIRFASPADRTAFAEELAAAITALVSRYHDESAPEGRPHRVVLAIHPTPRQEQS